MQKLEEESDFEEKKKINMNVIVTIIVVIICIISIAACLVFFFTTIVFTTMSLVQTFTPVTPNNVKIGILMPGFQYDKYFARLMLHSAQRAQSNLESTYGIENDIEFVLCEGCTYDETDLVVQVQSMYDSGVRLFVGPLTSSQCQTLGDWSSQSAPDTLFISPSATADILSSYGNIVRMIMSNTVRANAYASKFSEYRGETYVNESSCGRNSRTKVFSMWKNDVSSNDFYSLINNTADAHLLDLEPPVTYEKNTINSKADALPYIATLSSQLINTNSHHNASVIFIQAHDEITYILEAADDYPNVLEVDWFIIGMGFNQDLLLSRVSVKNAVKVKLSSLLYTGNGYTFQEEKKILVDDINGPNGYNYTENYVGILNPLIFSVYDSVLLMYDTIRMNNKQVISKDIIIREAMHEFGMTGHLKMNEEFYYRDSGQYSFVAVMNISSDCGWVVLSDVGSSPIVDDDKKKNGNFSLEYVINEKAIGVVHMSEVIFNDYCDVQEVEIEGVDKFGNFKYSTFDTLNHPEKITKIKQMGISLQLKNDKNFLKLKCNDVKNIFQTANQYYMWIVCPMGYSGNYPDCSFIFFDHNYNELSYYQYVLKSYSLLDAVYIYHINEWIEHGLAFFTDDLASDIIESSMLSTTAMESVFCQFKTRVGIFYL